MGQRDDGHLEGDNRGPGGEQAPADTHPAGTGRASGFEKWGFELTNECGRSVLVVVMQSPKHTGGLAGAFYVAGFVTPPRGASARQGNC